MHFSGACAAQQTDPGISKAIFCCEAATYVRLQSTLVEQFQQVQFACFLASRVQVEYNWLSAHDL